MAFVLMDEIMSKHANELARMRRLTREWSESYDFKDEPYEGRTDDIDITAEAYYCPCCDYDKPLAVNEKYGTLTCSNPYHVTYDEHCEYQYKLTAQRVNDGTFWTANFKYPLTDKDRIEQRLELLHVEADELPHKRAEAIRQFEQRKVDIAAEIKALEAKLKSHEK